MKTAEFLQYSFAENGDKNSVPIATDPQGGVSIQSGYPIAYSNDPSAGGKYIERPDFNWILNYFTKEIQAIQLNGINELNNTILTSVGYPKGARCAVWINVQTHKLDRNGATNPLCITIPIVSMKDNNQTDPYTSDSAVFGDWWIDDGNQLGDIKIVQANLSSAPSGYIDLAPNTAIPSYVKADYPRINAILGSSTSSQWGYFKSTSATNFTIINPRGYFPRVWSNGSTIDSGRDFLTLQNDAIRKLEGTFKGTDRSFWFAPLGGLMQEATGIFENLPDTQSAGNIHGTGAAGCGFKIDSSRTVPTASENRPYNFNSKWYIKA